MSNYEEVKNDYSVENIINTNCSDEKDDVNERPISSA